LPEGEGGGNRWKKFWENKIFILFCSRFRVGGGPRGRFPAGGGAGRFGGTALQKPAVGRKGGGPNPTCFATTGGGGKQTVGGKGPVLLCHFLLFYRGRLGEKRGAGPESEPGKRIGFVPGRGAVSGRAPGSGGRTGVRWGGPVFKKPPEGRGGGNQRKRRGAVGDLGGGPAWGLTKISDVQGGRA